MTVSRAQGGSSPKPSARNLGWTLAGPWTPADCRHEKPHTTKQSCYFRTWYEANRESVLDRVDEWKRAHRSRHLAAKRRSRQRHAERYRQNRRRSRLVVGAVQRSFSELAVYERDNWTCHLCGEPIDPAATDHRWRGTLDHLVPVSEGGDDVAWNVRPAHQTCNIKRGRGGTVQLLLPIEDAAA